MDGFRTVGMTWGPAAPGGKEWREHYVRGYRYWQNLSGEGVCGPSEKEPESPGGVSRRYEAGTCP